MLRDLAYVRATPRYCPHAAARWKKGRTSHEWITGHRCDQPVVGFVEKTHFKFTIDKNHRNKMNTEWSTSYFVGANGKTIEYLVATMDGVFSSTTITRFMIQNVFRQRRLHTEITSLKGQSRHRLESGLETPTSRMQRRTQ